MMRSFAFSMYRILGWGCIGLAVSLILLRVLCPYLMPTPAQLEKWVKTQLTYPTKINEIELTFDGYQPAITLSKVEIYSPGSSENPKIAANIEKIQLLLNIPQLLLSRLQLSKLVLIGANFGIEYDEKGILTVSGLPDLKLDLSEEISSQKIPLLKELLIQDSHIHFMLGDQRSLPLTQVRLWMHTHTSIQIRGSATVVGLIPSHIDLGADLPLWELPLVSKDKHFYCHWIGADLNQFEHFLPKNIPYKLHGLVDFKTSISVNKKHEITSSAQIELADIQIENEKTNLAINKVTGALFVDKQANQWTVSGQNWDFQNNEKPLDFKIEFSSNAAKKCWRLETQHFSLSPWDKLLINSPLFSSRWTTALKEHPLQSRIDYALIDLEKIENDWVVRVVDFQTTINDGKFIGTMELNLSSDKKLPSVELLLEADKMKVGNLLSIFPRTIMDKELLTWLDAALPGEGEVSSSIVLRGNLADFPFDNADGIFEAQLQLENAEFVYDKHWPEITHLNADLLFHNRSLFIHAHSGEIAGGRVLDADAVIPDLYAKIPQLTVDTEIVSTLQNGITILNQSPLKNSLAKTLSPLSFEGEMGLSLGLMLPLSLKSMHELKVKGIIEVTDASVILPWNIEAKALNGSVSFTQNSIEAKKLDGELFDGKAQFEINTKLTQNSPQILFQVQGHAKLEALEKILKINQTPTNELISGETDYSAQLAISSESSINQMNLVVNSDLVGITVQAPAPFGKAANEAKASEFKIYFDNNDLMRLAFKCGDELNGVYSLMQTKALWHSVGGHLHLGEKRLAKFREDGIFLIDGDIKNLNIQEWKHFVNKSSIFKLSLSNSAGENERSLEPMLQIHAENLVILDNLFPKTILEAQWDRSSAQWNIHFNGNTIKGLAIIPHGENNRDIVVNLQLLNLAKNKSETKITPDESTLANPISLQIKQLILDKHIITQINARIEPISQGYLFPKVKGNLIDTQVSFSGQWDYLLPSKQMTVKGKVNTTNISQTLKELGIKSTLKNAKGNISFALKWEGSPGAIDYPSLNGHADFTLMHGYIQGVNSGIGRVLSLVNLDNVQRRLNFDFSDVTKKGFAFDELTGKCQFGKGKMSSNNVMIKGPSAKIEAVGQADLVTQGLVGEIVVMPNVTASLPVAAAIAAGNPAVGAAVWVVDKMVGNKIQEINRLRYQIAGTWKSPQVNQVPFYYQSQKT